MDRVPPAVATNSVDLLYSILGLINKTEATFIGTDYNLSAAEAFARATYASIEFCNSFDILQFVP